LFAGVGLDPASVLARDLEARGARLLESKEIDRALQSGARVIVDDPLAFVGDGREAVCVAFSYRFEPAALAARAGLQAGSIGLPFAVTAEAICPSGRGPATLALDLLDAALYVTSLELDSAVLMCADPFVASLLFAHGAVGDVSAMASNAASAAAITVRGSHGSVAVNLSAPHMTVAGRLVRMGDTGTARMVRAFLGGEPLPSLAHAAALASRVGAVA
jgi:predicted dehydrogenase